MGRNQILSNTWKKFKILLYLNELIFKLIEKEVKQEKIFDAVINFYKILELGEAKNIEISLREFEYFLICDWLWF